MLEQAIQTYFWKSWDNNNDSVCNRQTWLPLEHLSDVFPVELDLLDFITECISIYIWFI
jgi:hypothetical protein